jgi:branched-chain amino acid transport system permease protein
MSGAYKVERWTRQSVVFSAAIGVLLLGLAFGPAIFPAGVTDRLTTLFVYIILAAMWNALAGWSRSGSSFSSAWAGICSSGCRMRG